MTRTGIGLGLLVMAMAACQPPPADLETTVRARLDSLEARTSLYAKDLNTGREIAIRADEPRNTLSVIKVPIMVLAYRDAEQGRLNLDQRHTVRREELRRGSGLIQTFAIGLAPTYRDLVAQMIITSDNTATDILINRLGLERVNQMLDQLGYPGTRLMATTGTLFRGVWEDVDPAHARLSDREVYERGFPNDSGWQARSAAFEADSTRWLGRTTAREMARMLEQIHQGELASRAHSDEMMRILRRQLYSSRLPRFISFQAGVAHKTGDWPPYAGNDVGIMFAPAGPIVVAVFATNNRGTFLALEEAEGRIAYDLLMAWGTPGDSAR